MRWFGIIGAFLLVSGCQKESFEVILPLNETTRSYASTARFPMIYLGRSLFDTIRITGMDEYSENVPSTSGIEGLKVEKYYKTGRTLDWSLNYYLEAIPIENTVKRKSDLLIMELNFKGRNGVIEVRDALPFQKIEGLSNYRDSVYLRGQLFTGVLQNNGSSDDLPFYYQQGVGVVGWITPTDTFVLQQ